MFEQGSISAGHATVADLQRLCGSAALIFRHWFYYPFFFLFFFLFFSSIFLRLDSISSVAYVTKAIFVNILSFIW